MKILIYKAISILFVRVTFDVLKIVHTNEINCTFSKDECVSHKTDNYAKHTRVNIVPI